MPFLRYPAAYKNQEQIHDLHSPSILTANRFGHRSLRHSPRRSTTTGPDEISHTADAIHQEVNFSVARQKGSTHVLLDTKQFDEMTRLIPSMQTANLGNSPTEISRELGGPFTLFRGHIIGRHVEFVPNQRIVQAWRVVDWDPGVYSIVKFELNAAGVGNQAGVRPYRLSRRPRQTPCGWLERALLGAAAEVSDLRGILGRICFSKPSHHLFELRFSRQTGDTI